MLRTRQLQGQDEDLEEVRLQKQRKRIKGKEFFDRTQQIQQAGVKEGDLVLQHDSVAEIDMSRNRKLSYKWLRPYRVWKAIPEKRTYILKEFDGTQLAGTYASNRLKKFVVRDCFYTLVAISPKDSKSSKDSNSPKEPEGSKGEELPSATVTVRRSAWI